MCCSPQPGSRQNWDLIKPFQGEEGSGFTRKAKRARAPHVPRGRCRFQGRKGCFGRQVPEEAPVKGGAECGVRTGRGALKLVLALSGVPCLCERSSGLCYEPCHLSSAPRHFANRNLRRPKLRVANWTTPSERQARTQGCRV